MPSRLRSQKIEIDLPTELSEPWVHVVVQKLILNNEGNTIQTLDRNSHIYKSINDYAMQLVNFTDPVTQQQYTISGAGLGQAITNMVLTWMDEKFDGQIVDGLFMQE